MLQNQRVIGGNVSREMVPWQVSIHNLYFGGHWCGGIILDKNTILSADHCFKPYFKYKIKAGSVDAYGSTGQVSSPNYEICSCALNLCNLAISVLRFFGDHNQLNSGNLNFDCRLEI